MKHSHIAILHRPRAPTLVLGGLAALFILGGGCVTVRYRTRIPAVSVHQVIAWSTAGVPAKVIVQRMKASHTVYRLTAAELADLHAKGVADPVINYMQRTYLAAVRHDQKLRDWRYWRADSDGYWYGGPWMGGVWGHDWGRWDED